MKTFADVGIITKRHNGLEKVKCPKCSHARKNKRDLSLSVNHQEGLWNCHHCGWSGSLGKLEKQEDWQEKKKEKEYVQPEVNNSGISDRMLEWFEGRGISKPTVMHFKISESQEFFPQVGKKRNAINFPLFEKGRLVNVKYRDAEKNFKMVGGAKLIFFGLQNLEGKNSCTIVEGEMDALSAYEAGVFNVVSVPNGASKGSRQNLEYLDHCIDYFEPLKQIVIAVDNDEAGKKLENELVRRLGKDRCLKVNYPEGCKDLNDVLLKYGSEETKQVVSQAKEYPIEGIVDFWDLHEGVHRIYRHGYPKVAKLGFDKFDNLLGFRTGEVTIVSGTPNSGKSEFLDQIMAILSRVHHWKFGILSAENQPPEIHAIKLIEKYAEKRMRDDDGPIMDEKMLFEAEEHFRNHYILLTISDENLSVELLINKITELVRRRGISAFVIDPYNYLEHKVPKGISETNYVSSFMTRLSQTAKALDIHVFLVAHPSKIDGIGPGKKRPHLGMVSGSQHFENKTDNGLWVHRDFDSEIITVYVLKVRFFFVGKRGQCQFSYHRELGGTYKTVSDYQVEQQNEDKRKKDAINDMGYQQGKLLPSPPEEKAPF